jgi:hypothetical protein
MLYAVQMYVVAAIVHTGVEGHEWQVLYGREQQQ